MVDPAGANRVAGRTCGPCTLCCKIMAVHTLGKPQGEWCRHVADRVGCSVYDDRPDECRSFFCGWLIDPNLGDEWQPSTSRIILVAQRGQNRLSAHVDPGRPDAWRRTPYYPRLKEWARAAARVGGQVVVYIGRHAFLVLPDRDVDLGTRKDERAL